MVIIGHFFRKNEAMVKAHPPSYQRFVGFLGLQDIQVVSGCEVVKKTCIIKTYFSTMKQLETWIKL